MNPSNSKSSRGLIRSMLVIGSAQSLNILLSIVRMKVLALLLGPAGVGLLGVYNNLQQMVVQLAGLGMGSSGVRQIALAKEDDQNRNIVRKTLLTALFVQGTLAMIGVWLLRKPLAIWLTGDISLSTEIGLVGVAVMLMLLATANTAILQGIRKIGDLGRVTVISALTSTVFGLLAVFLFGKKGLIWFLLIQPLANFGAALYYVRRLPVKSTYSPLRLYEIWNTWKPMVRLGSAFMLGGLATASTLLLVRSFVTQDLGLEAAGYFAASWGVSMTYIGFLLGAMGTDYYPRLTEVIHDLQSANQLMNDQAQLSLAIGGPILLLLIGWAPLFIDLLYSSDFGPAATILQWQAFGNVFKMASWSLSFAIVAAARSRIYVIMEFSFNLVFLSLIWLFLPSIGIEITGIAFLIGYITYFITVYLIVRRLRRFNWHLLSLKLLVVHIFLAVGVLILSMIAPEIGLISTPFVAIATGVLGVRVVLRKIGPGGRLANKVYEIFAKLGWPIRIVR